MRNIASIQLPSQTPMYIDALGVDYPAATDVVNQALMFFVDTTTGSGGVGTATNGTTQGRCLKNPSDLTQGWDNTATGEAAGQVHALRHLEGSNYGFVDGHVKWLKGNNPLAQNSLSRPGLDYNSDGNVGWSGATN